MYVITIKLPRDPNHNPADKQTGECPVSVECTDVTGQHHSYAVADDALGRELARWEHVTRVEKV